MLISAAGLPVAQLPVSITIGEGPGSGSAEFRTTSAGMIRDVFGSYAREDAAIVARLRAAYRALGIHLFVDTQDIDTGQPWRRYLRERIERSDLFQLFWSSAAAGSAEVEREWRQALEIGEICSPGTNFIRPVYWKKPPPTPPPDLAHLNFWYLDPQDFGGAPEPGPGGGSSDSPAAGWRADVRFPVIPLAPDPGGVTAGNIQDALRAIVPFMENVTGLRYYPPVSYLVDDEMVISLRKTAEPDARRVSDSVDMPVEPPRLSADDETLLRSLRDLLVRFHSYANRGIASLPDADHIQHGADSFVQSARDYLAGRQGGVPKPV